MFELSKEKPLVSIVIPCKKVDSYTRECIEKCKDLDYEKFEIILLPDTKPSDEIKNVKVIPTGPLTPGAKRNIGVKNSKGEVLAFIDSDAYPRKDWLKNALKYLKDDVAAVGGPGLTPPSDSLMQKASGYILSSFMVGGLSRRYKASKPVYSDDIHSCNFIALKSIIKEVGGWNEKYWPGEDTLLCLAIKKTGKKMIEAPDVIVYHHRRPLFKEHLRQIAGFGLHRGFFAKKFKDNSLKLSYFIPSIILLSLVIGSILSVISHIIRIVFLTGIMAYLITCLASAILAVRKDVKLIPLVYIGIIATHITYGTYFLLGLIKRDLER